MEQIYDLTFRYGRAGEASALSWLLFASSSSFVTSSLPACRGCSKRVGAP